GILVDADPRPDRRHQLVLGHQAAGIFDQVTQDLEALGPQRLLAVSRGQAAAMKVEGKPLEAIDSLHGAWSIGALLQANCSGISDRPGAPRPTSRLSPPTKSPPNERDTRSCPMAHIAPNPPNRDSANQSMQKFNILTTTGEADIFAWGLPNTATEMEFMIALAGLGPDNSDRIVVSMAQRPGPYANMRRFHLKGLRTGDQIAIFRNSNFNQPYDINWVQHSAAVTVDKIVADRYAQALVAGTLPKYTGNSNIELYPFG